MRIERDSMGEIQVPQEALYGASTQRAVLNFPVSDHPMPPRFIRTMGLLKYACACANETLGRISGEKAQLLKEVSLELFNGGLDKHFPVTIFQTGSCTSSNMNCNEVLSNRAAQKAGFSMGSKRPLHPNDDCNLGQSSNDTMPTVLHLSVALALREELTPALQGLLQAIKAKSEAWENIVKIGRTHLMDATPLTLGQEFSGYARQIEKAIERCEHGMRQLRELAIGGTAVGTGINSHPHFAELVISCINQKTGLHCIEAANHFEAQGGRDDCVEVAGILATVAASLSKIANDIRLMGSGPRAGIGELVLPALQPGSSIMPGKTNPIMCEMVVQVAIYVQGLTAMVHNCGCNGHFELNATLPLIAYALLESIQCLTHATNLFTERCITGLQTNNEQIQRHLSRSLMLVTALTPHIGYDKAAEIAKRAYTENKTLREIILEEHLMDPAHLDSILDPHNMLQATSGNATGTTS